MLPVAVAAPKAAVSAAALPAPGTSELAAAAAANRANVAAIKAAALAALGNTAEAFRAQMGAATKAAAAAAGTKGPAAAAAALLTDLDARRRIFDANVAKIVTLNAAAGPDLAFGVNKFSHLSQSEFRAIYLSGLILDTDSADSAEPALTQAGGRRLLTPSNSYSVAEVDFPFGSVSLPSSVDWRVAGFVTPPRDQLNCGSCAAYTTIGVTESAYIAASGSTNTTTDLSEQELLECTAGDQCQGWTLKSYMDRRGRTCVHACAPPTCIATIVPLTCTYFG
jgi:hypothetical protein